VELYLYSPICIHGVDKDKFTFILLKTAASNTPISHLPYDSRMYMDYCWKYRQRKTGNFTFTTCTPNPIKTCLGSKDGSRVEKPEIG
jgi:hypothetical protein